MREFNKFLKEISLYFSRSGGKGGQNVNKVETKVELIFNVLASSFLDNEQKETLLKNLKNRIDKEGNLRIVSQNERSQLANRKIAIEKFLRLIEKSLMKKKKRIKTKIPDAVKSKVLESKRKHSAKKKDRKKPDLLQ